MSVGLAPIQFNNIPVAAGGGAVAGADEGLDLIGGNVQLGTPFLNPDISKAIDVSREIQLTGDGVLSMCGTSGHLTGNKFEYRTETGVEIDGRESGGSGESTRFNFLPEGLRINASNVTNAGMIMAAGFPVGSPAGYVNLRGSDTRVGSFAGGIAFETNAAETYVGDIGYGYGLNVGFEPGGGSSIVTYSNTSDVRIVTGISDGVSPGKFVTWAPSASDVQIVTEINTSTGYMAVAGGNTLSGAMVNIGSGNNAAAQLNFTANGVVANDGDLDYNGTNLIFQNPAGACSLLASAGVSAGPVVMDNTNYVEVIIAGNPVKLLIAV